MLNFDIPSTPIVSHQNIPTSLGALGGSRSAHKMKSAHALNVAANIAATLPLLADSVQPPSQPKTPLRPAVASCKTPKSGAYSDRFIPNRDALNTAMTSAALNNENVNPADNAAPQSNISPSKQAPFIAALSHALYGDNEVTSKILTFKGKAPKPSESHLTNMRSLYSANRDTSTAPTIKRAHRYISAAPERVLDAPELTDDYYLNLLDWSANNLLAVALGSAVYLWDAGTGNIDRLCEMKEGESITSVSWMTDGSHLAVATTMNDVQLWSVEHSKQVRIMRSHRARVGALSWNNHVVSSGSRDSTIHHHDVRIAKHHTHTLTGHTQEICGLKWSPDGTQLASGANDNTCNIYDVNGTLTPRFTMTEAAAAVKALAWCPFQRNVLATGAGSADRHIRFYNTTNGSMINAIDTHSQVCSLQWSKTERELLSSHGFSQNQLTVWKYPTMVKVTDLIGHNSRVLHTAISPDGSVVCSAAADETLRMWRVWEPLTVKKFGTEANSHASTKRTLLSMNIR